MIKFVATASDGGTMLFLGLTADNLRLLPQDMPIRVDLAELGLGAGQDITEIIIFSGRTEMEMMDDLKRAGMIGPDTAVTVDPRLE